MQRSPSAGPRLFVAVVGASDLLRRAAAAALSDLVRDSGRVLVPDPGLAARSVPAAGPDYAELIRRARFYLDRALPAAELHLISCDKLADLPGRLPGPGTAEREDAVALILVEREIVASDRADLDEELDQLVDLLDPALPVEISPYTVVAYGRHLDSTLWWGPRYSRRLLPAEAWPLAADVVTAFTDWIQARYLHPRDSESGSEGVLARSLYDFLTQRAGCRWGLHSYTGSVVSGLIEELEGLARAAGNPVLRGPSEHSLACAALARWQLEEAPFLLVVTSGMVDELRGTLANLRRAGARGLLVFAEAPPNRWFPFQGTLSPLEDAREVFRARGVPVSYLHRPEDLGDGLAVAFQAYEQGDGPVALLATPAVLEHRRRPGAPISGPAAAATRPGRIVVDEDATDAVATIVNEEPARLLWQCGALDAEAAALTYDLARRAGIALADSITRPGTVSAYRDGRPVEEYLGTLGRYGSSARVHDFLHRAGRLRPAAEQWLFFLASRIDEIATPFSERALRRDLRIVQVSRNAGDLAPFTDRPVQAEVSAFVRRLGDRVEVMPEVLRLRRDAIRATAEAPVELHGQVPVLPMSPNYFFRRLAGVVTQLIRNDGYTYTGVYDVGRGGVSAIRNLPRTGPGFSGWYGRALMGDALQAVPGIALSRPGNVLAFIGDGAAALVPDILPTLVEQAVVEGRRPEGNLSVFRLLNGAHSIIRTYREAGRRAPIGNQSTVLSLVDEDWDRSYGPLDVRHRRLVDVDAAVLRDQLLRPDMVSLYSVLLHHTNDGDGMGPFASLEWQHDPISPLALEFARRRTAALR